MTISMYHHWGMEMLLFYKHLTAGSFSSLDSLSSSPFVKKDAKLEFTEEEKAALAVFTLIIIFCIIEIILAAAIIKISGCQTPQTAQTPQSPQMYYMYPGMHIQVLSCNALMTIMLSHQNIVMAMCDFYLLTRIKKDVYTRLKKIKRGYKQLKGTKRFRHVCHHQG